MTFKGISQNATDPLVQIPQSQLIKGIIDIEANDACQLELKIANENLEYWYQESMVQDSIIKIYKEKEIYYNNNIETYKSIVSFDKEYIKTLEKQNKFFRVKNTFLTVLVIGIPTFIYLVK